MKSLSWRVVFVGLMGILGCAGAAHAEWWAVTNLGTFTGNSSGTHAISESGNWIAGVSRVGGTFFRHAFRTNGDPLDGGDDLGTNGFNESEASGVNDSGQVAGYSNTGTTERAFLYSVTTMTNLGVLGTGDKSRALGINNSGKVVGYSYDGSLVGTPLTPTHKAFSYTTSGSMQELSLTSPPVGSGYSYTPSFSLAWDINDSDTIVGFASLNSSAPPGAADYHAFILDSSGAHDLETLAGYSRSVATAVNQNGVAVGWAENYMESGYKFRPSHAFVTVVPTGGGYDLSDIHSSSVFNSSRAWDVNLDGWIVGALYNQNNNPESPTNPPHAFLYRNSLMTDLNTLLTAADQEKWTLVEAYGVSDTGVIVGRGYYRESLTAPYYQRAFSMQQAVPEPSMLAALAGLGVMGLVAWLRKRQ